MTRTKSKPGQMTLRLHTEELIVDSFAGGGGASVGIEMALGRSPDIAINHDPEAVAMHAENHPGTRHFCEDVFNVDPVEATQGRSVALAWFSPDCKHHSKAKGGKPLNGKIRGLAWVATKWAREVHPRVLILENVEEFKDWGPLGADDRPIKSQKGHTFNRWVRELERAGYVVELRKLKGCDYGAPTTRRRLFVIARCDGQEIVWPTPTHGTADECAADPTLLPHLTAASCIDWSVPTSSIFERSKPLVENTLKRIARGVFKYVIDSDSPFIVERRQGRDSRTRSTLIQTGYGERPTQVSRVPGLHKPLGTVVGCGIKHALVSAFLAKHYSQRATGGWNGGSDLASPFGTVTTKDHHALVSLPLAQRAGRHSDEVAAFLDKYYGTAGVGTDITAPVHTLTGKDRMSLVAVGRHNYQIADIGMRMLIPRELYAAQGFPADYRIEFSIKARPLSKGAQVRMAGNSVCPPLAAALVRANVQTRRATLTTERMAA